MTHVYRITSPLCHRGAILRGETRESFLSGYNRMLERIGLIERKFFLQCVKIEFYDF